MRRGDRVSGRRREAVGGSSRHEGGLRPYGDLAWSGTGLGNARAGYESPGSQHAVVCSRGACVGDHVGSPHVVGSGCSAKRRSSYASVVDGQPQRSGVWCRSTGATACTRLPSRSSMASGQPSCALLSSVVRLCSSQSSTPCCKRCWVCSLSPQTACRCVRVLALLWVVPPREVVAPSAHMPAPAAASRVFRQEDQPPAGAGGPISHAASLAARRAPCRHERNERAVRAEGGELQNLHEAARLADVAGAARGVDSCGQGGPRAACCQCVQIACSRVCLCVDAGRLAPRKRRST